MTGELAVFIEGRPAGTLTEDRHGRLDLTYARDYADDPASTPLSLSAPLAAAGVSGDRLLAFLWGLLPDSGDVLARWGAQYQVSASSVFGLLRHVGEECAGAVQFVRPDRVDGIHDGGVDWLDDSQVADRLRLLREDPTAWQSFPGGQFSLAGAQAKIALRREGGRWGQPWGSEPTTVILKPAVGRLADQEIDEHLTLELARAAGLTAARSALLDIAGERVACIDRYDRIQDDKQWTRIHQEDLCQAAGVRPANKYQADGGPGPADIARLIRTNVRPRQAAEAAINEFLDALAFSWLVAGTDGHAKNYSILLAGPEVRLAPLYDLVSVLPFVSRQPGHDRSREWQPSDLKLAMRIGAHRGVQEIDRSDWLALAGEVGVDGEVMLDRVHGLLERLADRFVGITARPAVAQLKSPLVDRYQRELTRHLGICRAALQGRGVPRRRHGAQPDAGR